jgi:hypothetical protein
LKAFVPNRNRASTGAAVKLWEGRSRQSRLKQRMGTEEQSRTYA